jgi:hypothetical protein
MLLAPCVGLVKIGCSADPLGRMLDLRTMNACEVEPLLVLRVPEATLHQKFAKLRHHGEWFTVHKDIVDYLEEILELHAAERMTLALDRSCCV